MRLLIVSALLLLSAMSALGQPSLEQQTEQILPEMVSLYRTLHSQPELSSKEAKTSARLAQELKEIGLEVHEGIGGYGLMAILRGQAGGPVILYRADMDALPVTEETGLPYASLNEGVMHACGHDIHMSCAVGTLKLMAAREDWKGTIVFIGQPAEETGSGAEAMIADPKFSKVLESAGGKPVAAIALHDNADLLAGQAAITPGWITANVDSVDIDIIGRGGHGARPHQSVDPIVIGAELVSAMQTIVSRKLPPGTRAVVTTGVFKAGTKRNIIPTKARLELTIRSYEESARRTIIEEIERLATQIAAAHNAPKPPIVVHRKNYTPAGWNDKAMVEKLRPVFEAQLGPKNLIEIEPSTVGEDFSEYSRQLGIPSVIFLLGTAAPGSPKHPLHSSKFAPVAEPTLRAGIPLVAGSLMKLLND